MRRLLLVSDRPRWGEALGLALESADDLAICHGLRAPCDYRGVQAPDALIIDSAEGLAFQPGSVDETANAARALRARFPSAPIVLVMETPRDDIGDLAIDIGGARALLPESLTNIRQLAADILAAVDTCPRFDSPADASSATIEITIRHASIDCDVRVDGLVRFIGPRAFTSREQLRIVDDDFRHFESTAEVFRQKVDLHTMSSAGRHIRAALRGPLEIARRFYPGNVTRPECIQYRFALSDGDFEFVPFEVMPTANDNEYLRDVHPFARRLLPRAEHRRGNPVEPSSRPRQRILFIASNAEGLLSVPSHTFKSLDSISLRRLEHIDAERQGVEQIYRDQARILTLDPAADPHAQIERTFEENDFDIVHFAGHSARADGLDGGGKVFLALPAAVGTRQVRSYPAERLASLASSAGTRLVVLSSCEGCSGTTFSRMASWGVPAVAGFRWPVDDADASFFTLELHRQLECFDGRAAVTQAFYRALAAIKARSAGRLSAFSPVLMLQQPGWHDFHLGD